MQNHERRLHFRGVIHRRVTRIRFPVGPRPRGEAALAALEDGAVGAAAVFVDDAVHADHVGQRRAGDGRSKHIRLRDRERRLVPTPRVAVQAHALRIHHTSRHRRLDGRRQRPRGRHARVVDVVLDVGLQHRVPVAGVRLAAEAVGRRPAVLVVPLRQALVDVHDRRVRLALLVVGGQVERRLQALALVVLEFDELGASRPRQ